MPEYVRKCQVKRDPPPRQGQATAHPLYKMNKQERLDINRIAWDAYQADYMQFNLKERPDFFERLGKGEVLLDDEVVELAGDVAGLDLLDTCCASDAMQAFSWANLGARVTACDIAPTAIAIARKNALRLGLDVKFYVTDAQTLDPISNESQDLVFATYLGWFEDIELAVSTWTRVLRPGGRLLIDIDHPVTNILERTNDGLRVERPYFDRSPESYEFTGTPLALRHGGWGKAMPIIWFHHTLADIINAVVHAGLRIERFAERPHEGTSPGEGPSELPDAISILALKPPVPAGSTI